MYKPHSPFIIRASHVIVCGVVWYCIIHHVHFDMRQCCLIVNYQCVPYRYCDCFANGEFCNNCNCVNCFNNLGHESDRLKAIKVITCCLSHRSLIFPSLGNGITLSTFPPAGLFRQKPSGLQAQDWQRQRRRVGQETQQRLQLQKIRLSEELLRVLRGERLNVKPSSPPVES